MSGITTLLPESLVSILFSFISLFVVGSLQKSVYVRLTVNDVDTLF